MKVSMESHDGDGERWAFRRNVDGWGRSTREVANFYLNWSESSKNACSFLCCYIVSIETQRMCIMAGNRKKNKNNKITMWNAKSDLTRPHLWPPSLTFTLFLVSWIIVHSILNSFICTSHTNRMVTSCRLSPTASNCQCRSYSIAFISRIIARKKS